MGQVTSGARRIVERYIEELEKNKIHIEKAIVFGSHSKGLTDQWSDIDIALVSDSFEGVRMDDKKKIRHITLSVSSDLSPLPFRPEDFTENDPLVREILETGVRVV